MGGNGNTDNDFELAEKAVRRAQMMLDDATYTLASYSTGEDGKFSIELFDQHQEFAYGLAHVSAGLEAAKSMLEYAKHGELEATLAYVFIAQAVNDCIHRVQGVELEWGTNSGDVAKESYVFRNKYLSTETLEKLANAIAVNGLPPDHLDDFYSEVRSAFGSFAQNKIKPIAGDIHRDDQDVPEELLQGMAELGVFGLSVPEEYGGTATGGVEDFLSMVVVTEELSNASLAAGGSLVTRPEILVRALLEGGTEEQKQRFLPRIAEGKEMVGIMVTEPDYGSDVAGIRTKATKVENGWLLSGNKTWCTFAGRANLLLVLARTDPDPKSGNKGLTAFIVEKESFEGHEFETSQEGIGKISGTAIPTIGYRGMHSFDVSFQEWFVPDENVIGLDDGLGTGFKLQMAAFENGRLQTAARASGVMRAAIEAGFEYSQERQVFGSPVFDQSLTKARLAKMVASYEAGKQLSYKVANLMGVGEGSREASMVKAFVCRAAEGIARDAQQMHGGMGYAEEYDVSRYFVDARVLSIFEGADEVLALRVISRGLVQDVISSQQRFSPETPGRIIGG